MFLEWPPTGWTDRAEILDRLRGIFCATFVKKKIPVQVRTRRYDVMRSTAYSTLFDEFVFTATYLVAIDSTGDMQDLVQKMATSNI